MEARRQEIEAKKQRLEELRKQREQRLGQIEGRTASLNPPTVPSPRLKQPVGDASSTSSAITESETTQNTVLVGAEPVKPSVSTEKEFISAPPPLILSKGVQTDSSYLEKSSEESSNGKDKEATLENVADIHTEVPSTQYPTIDGAKLSSFLANSFKIINRAIQEDNDILKNYQDDQAASKVFDNSQKQQLFQKKFVISPASTQEQQQSGVFSIDFSHFSKDLVAFSTGKHVHIYNMRFHKMEYQLRSTSDITSVRFFMKSPHLLIGTCFNGKIKVWDLSETDIYQRDNSDIARQSSNSQDSHSYPLVGLVQFIENNRELLITTSSDGKVCHWDAALLSKTTSEPFTLKASKENVHLSFYDEITPTALVRLGKAHRNDLLVGAEDGNLYQFASHSSMIKTVDKVLSIDTTWKCHEASITAVCAPASGSELSDIVATASMDWKCCCWNVITREKVLEIYRNFPILDIAFRPNNPLHLALIYHDTFEIVNLLNSSIVLSLSTRNGILLNKLKFYDDRTVALGDIKGDVTVWDLSLDKVADEDIFLFRKKHSF